MIETPIKPGDFKAGKFIQTCTRSVRNVNDQSAPSSSSLNLWWTSNVNWTAMVWVSTRGFHNLASLYQATLTQPTEVSSTVSELSMCAIWIDVGCRMFIFESAHLFFSFIPPHVWGGIRTVTRKRNVRCDWLRVLVLKTQIIQPSCVNQFSLIQWFSTI